MENEVKKLMEWLSDASNFTLPEYSSLPAVPLYMEQVIMYISKILDPISVNEKNKLTSFMVNNYVKAGMIDPPEKKKYSEDHLGYLLAITVLKDTFSMTDLSLLIEMDNDLSEDKSVLYRFFASMSTNTIQEKAKSILSKVESYQRRYEKEAKEDKELAEKHLKDYL